MTEVEVIVKVVTEIISQVGFPIAVSFYLLWVNHDSNRRHRENLKEFREAINNNTQVLQELVRTLK